jgi:hypothetical protein
LPYGVKIETEYFTKATLVEIRKNISYGACKDLLVTYDISGEETPYQSEQRSSTISKIKPYLFPLSSMTEEQKIIYGDLCYAVIHSLAWDMQAALNELIDWLNKNHFDYRGLIEKGLAIDATGLNIY